jgi:hypothetical protein
MSKRMNPQRRLAVAARKAVMAERNAAHPAIRSPKGLGVSTVHVDSLLGASHTVGFSGAGRGVGAETRIIDRKGNLAKSVTRMSDAPKGFQSLADRPLAPDVPDHVRQAVAKEHIPYVRYTAPKSAPFASRAPREVYTNDETLASNVERVLVKRGKGRFKKL